MCSSDLTQSKTIEVTKIAVITDSNGNGGTPDVGDVINYTITVANKGNVTISSVTFVENFKDGVIGTLMSNYGLERYFNRWKLIAMYF